MRIRGGEAAPGVDLMLVRPSASWETIVVLLGQRMKRLDQLGMQELPRQAVHRFIRSDERVGTFQNGFLQQCAGAIFFGKQFSQMASQTIMGEAGLCDHGFGRALSHFIEYFKRCHGVGSAIVVEKMGPRSCEIGRVLAKCPANGQGLLSVDHQLSMDAEREQDGSEKTGEGLVRF